MKYEYLENGSSEICELILRKLPNWFGIEESTLAYIDGVKDTPMLVAKDGERAVGFLSYWEHSPYSVELYVMGVDPEYHRKGLGKELVLKSEDILRKKGIEFYQVKTVDESRECQFYRKTRLFYKSMGFKELEVFPTLWDENNPCLLMVKSLK